MITTIIFDLGETYINGVLGLEKRLEPILGKAAAQIYAEMQGENLVSLFKGEISEEEYWRRAIEKNSWKTDIPTLKKLLRENFIEIKGTREIIEALKAKGFRLGLLSIHTKEWIEYCEHKYGYLELFDATEYSFEIGVLKPDKRAYQRIMKKLGVNPEECVFIDDNSNNLRAAEALGIRTVLFESPKQLRSGLASLGIKV
jgi:putative hydrolase of the HAD superfamily